MISHFQKSFLASHWSRTTEQLLLAAQNLAFERGRTAVVLRGDDPISEANREFIDHRRELADQAIAAAIRGLKENKDPSLAEQLQNQWDLVKDCRASIERAVLLPREERETHLVATWEDRASTMLQQIRMTALELLSSFDSGKKPAQFNYLAITALDLRLTAGWKASLITQALSANRYPDAEELAAINALRGREAKLWEDSTRLAVHLDDDDLHRVAIEVRELNEQIVGPLQEQALAGLLTKEPPEMSMAVLLAPSVPYLDGISSIMILATKKAITSISTMKITYGVHFLILLIVLVSLIGLVLLALRYVTRHIVAPIERIDQDLHRIGAFTRDEWDGNEVRRLGTSVKKLEDTIAARTRAEAERERTIAELTAALDQIKTLSGLIPICASCKKIRDDNGYWERLESYLAARTDAQFSHGLCPDCYDKAMKELDV